MNGKTRETGAVSSMKDIKQAISVARKVMEKTHHSMIVGRDATNFALKVGFNKTNLRTERSEGIWQNWLRNGRKPNFWKENQSPKDPLIGHDTIGQVALDSFKDIACGTSTNGATFKIPGRVGDSSLVGSGAYCENGVGGAAATGDGDVTFLPI
jgi:N4-(beta-N-acetylglucosaminyl)-L-asparaginase